MDTLLIRLGAAFAIGLFVGIERGWVSRKAEDHRRAAGFRTFAISGLLGGVCGALAIATAPIVLGAALLAFAGLLGAFEWLEARKDQNYSATSAVAGLFTFALGAYAVLGDVQIAVACGVVLTAMLALREPLHQWVASLRLEELRAALILLAMTFLALPLLPNRTVDPWDTLNPAEIWLFAILIAAISFAGYVAIRWWGQRRGIVMAAIAGGLASSTATTLTLARLGRHEAAVGRLLAGGIVLSGAVMMARVAIIATLLGKTAILPLQAALGSAIAVMLVSALAMLGRRSSEHSPEIVLTSPMELGTALKLALAIGVVMLVARLVQDWLGPEGVLAVASVSGLFDVDAVSVSMSRMAGVQVATDIAMQAMAVAVAVNSLAKSVMAWVVGGARIGLLVGLASLVSLAAGATVLFLV